MTLLTLFWKDERGQDIIEYALLMAFVALAASGTFLGVGGAVASVWSKAGTNLASMNAAVN